MVGDVKISGEMEVGCAASLTAGICSWRVFFLQLHPFCAYLTSALSVTVCAGQVLAVTTHIPQSRVEQGCFQPLLTHILNKELVLPINESEFAFS